MADRVDVFYREYTGNYSLAKWQLRAHLSLACRDRWKMQMDANLILVLNHGQLADAGFHMASKRWAEEHAKTDVYVVADDDCLILGRDFVTRGVALMNEHKEFGALAGVSISDGFADLDIAPDVHISETVEGPAGGVVFVRRGVLTDFDDCEPDQVDDVIYQEFKRKGWKVGVMPYVKFNHLGAGYSVTSRSADNWRA